MKKPSSLTRGVFIGPHGHNGVMNETLEEEHMPDDQSKMKPMHDEKGSGGEEVVGCGKAAARNPARMNP